MYLLHVEVARSKTSISYEESVIDDLVMLEAVPANTGTSGDKLASMPY